MSVTTEIVQLIPVLFHRLRAVVDELHGKHEVTTPMRGVMMSLNENWPQTVPHMAAGRPVPRQHIQTQVDALAEKRLVQILPNPKHKRSSLIDLTDEGCELIQTMRQAEAEIIEVTLGRSAYADLEATHSVLTAFAEQLNMVVRDQKGGRS